MSWLRLLRALTPAWLALAGMIVWTMTVMRVAPRALPAELTTLAHCVPVVLALFDGLTVSQKR